MTRLTSMNHFVSARTIVICVFLILTANIILQALIIERLFND
jgi:hypothetical protein